MVIVSVKPPPSWLVRLNTAVLRRGLTIGSQHLLTVPGRKTGEPRSTPVSIAVVDGERYIVAAFADAGWVANVRAAGHGTLGRGRETEEIRLSEVRREARGPILRAFLRQVRGGTRFFGTQTPDEIVAGAERYPVFHVSVREDDRATRQAE
jgi:deazaflavin-dependent oxidoreductase (nitroreductase family)